MVVERPEGKVWSYKDYLSGRIHGISEVRKTTVGTLHVWLEYKFFKMLYKLVVEIISPNTVRRGTVEAPS